MKYGGRLLVCMLGGISLGTAAAITQDTPENGSPYQEITSRNVFALKPPPPPPNPEDNKPPPSKITLTGITTMVGKKVLMKTPPPPVKPGTPPGAPPAERFYMLSEGERDGDIQVVAIDEKAGTVKVLNGGVEVTLTFDKDGQKLPSTPVAAAPGLPGVLPAPAGFNPGMTTPGFNPAATGIRPTFPVRPMRGTADGASTGAGFQPAGNVWPGLPSPTPGATPSAVPLPAFNSAQPNQAALSQAAMPDRLYSPEEQAILIEANRTKSPFSSLLPPTPLNQSTIDAPVPPNQGQGQQNPNAMNFPPLPGRR